jgi:hypothetical protein
LIEASIELRARGQRQASLVFANRAVRWLLARSADNPGQSARDLAHALYLAEQWEESRQVYERLTQERPNNWGPRGMLGCLAARLGNRDEALRVSDDLAGYDGPRRRRAWRTYHRACIAALLGERDRAMSLLYEALDQGLAEFTLLQREIDFESLHDYPPFQELLRPKG